MKANEFVKKFGWDFSKSCIENMVFSVGSFGGCVCVPKDLKRIIESYELVESEGGLLNVRNSFQMERDCGGVDLTPFGEKLYQAIADVESCM